MLGIKKKFVLVLLICLIIASIIFVFVARHQYELSLQLPDNNGKNKSLCIITNEMIESYTEEYNAIKSSVLSKGSNSSNLSGVFEDCDNEYSKLKFGMLTGVYVANACLGNGNNIVYTIHSTVNSGNFKMVITDEANKILQEIPIDGEYSVTIPSESGKTYYFKLVGERANVEVAVTRAMQ